MLRRHVISWQDLCRANVQVTGELMKLGLWSSHLDEITVYWVTASWSCYGWFDGHIYIPAISLPQLSDLIAGRHMRLTDVLRHEWSHALADRLPRLMDTRRFVRTFGGPYESCAKVSNHNPDEHFTAYSATMPAEDFAEVFSYFVRHKGRLPARYRSKPVIVRKWQFVEWLATRIAGRRQAA